MQDRVTLQHYLRQADEDLAAVVATIAETAATLADEIAGGGLSASATVGRNVDGDGQTALDVLADTLFRDALVATSTRWYASEERAAVEELSPAGRYAVAIDPLDGSSNIDANVAVGTIAAVYPSGGDGTASILARGREQVAALYVIYGPRTEMMLTIRDGVACFTLDRAAGVFCLTRPNVAIPRDAPEFAINVSNYRHWERPIRAYIDDCVAGSDGPRSKDFNMRWIASLVAEAHRIFSRGGIFLYPSDARPAYRRGRLRHVYEANPIALLVERAGGLATDGCDGILDLPPASLHARTPLVFGSRDKVARVAAYHEIPAAEIAPLFGQRGLFTA